MFEKPTPLPVENPKDEKSEAAQLAEWERQLDQKEWSLERRKSYLAQGLEFTVGIHYEKPDTVVFLDTGARPLAGFIRQIWRRAYPDEQPPTMKFLNFHTRDWRGPRPPAPPAKIKEAFLAAENDFSGKRVLIVDEDSPSGYTLQEARRNLSAAFPEVKEVLIGTFAGRRDSTYFDVPPPYSPTASQALGYVLRGSKNEVSTVPGEPLSQAIPGVKASQATSARLREIGRNETLDEGFLKSLKEGAVRLGESTLEFLEVAERFKAPPKPEAE